MDIFSALVFVSDDYGKHWRALNGNLPFEPVNVIREDLINQNIVYVGTDNGLYVTFNQGLKWEKLGQLPRVAIHDLAINAKQNELVVGTHGRSLYVISLNELNTLDSTKLTKNLMVFKLPNVKVSKNWGQSSYFWNPPKQSKLSIPFYSYQEQNIKLTITDSLGVTLYDENIKGLLGVNYVSYNFTANQNQTLSKFVKKGEDGKFYLISGTYILQLKSEVSMNQTELIIESKKD